MNTRKYLPTFAELIDRLSICQLKSIFIPNNKEDYDQEIKDIQYDLDQIIEEKKGSGLHGQSTNNSTYK